MVTEADAYAEGREAAAGLAAGLTAELGSLYEAMADLYESMAAALRRERDTWT